jgi:hypothetical protein
MLRIFYHNDHDGKLAAYWSLQYYKREKDDYALVRLYEMDYGKTFPLEEIFKGDEVWIVDYSLEPEVMKSLRAKDGIVFWIDHHKSAIEKYADFDWGTFQTIRCTTSEFAASTLVWGVVQFLHQAENQNGRLLSGSITEEVVKYIREHKNKIPWATRYVGDWDTWTHAYDESIQFLYGSSLYDLSPISKFWDEVNCGRNESLSQPLLLSAVLQAGKVINQYKDNFNAEYRKSFGYEVTWPNLQLVNDIEDLKCMVLNLGRCSSLAFGDAIKKYIICISTVYVKNHWQVSLYSESEDTSKIASQFLYNGSRGGGHKGASGFSCEKLPWET